MDAIFYIGIKLNTHKKKSSQTLFVCVYVCYLKYEHLNSTL